MKLLNTLYYTLIGIALTSCSKSTFSDINTDPNRPTSVTTPTLLVTAEKQLVNALRSEDISLRGPQLFAQYFSQNIYTDQSRYQIPTSYSDNYWTATYKALNNLNEIIKLNSNESTKVLASAGTAGSNANQIAIARILKSYAFHSLSDVFGNIPYQSYGNPDPDFQALQQDPDNLIPAYASQEKIYKDILNELQQAADTLIKYQSATTFGPSDVIYKGNNNSWAKFANSLRLRLATHIKNKDASLAQAHIEDAIKKGVFTSNSDNAVFKYSKTSPNEAPLYRATVTANRKDFAVSNVIVEALQGKRGPFKTADPRLAKYAKPTADGSYFGQPYGLPLAAGNLFPVEKISLPGEIINAADYAEVLLEYAEVAFLLSENNNWDQANYEKAVRASLEKWGVAQPDISTYLAQLPAANKEYVLSQKYIALFNQSIEAWTEIRRTGYPLYLIKKGDVTWSGTVEGKPVTYTFTPEVGNAIPSRLVYPLKEQSTNKLNYQAALAQQGDDVISTKLWWNK
ncbi:SusD/RagB family nutrient-binding outer membrane lipoprotein [Sphingobacterium sp. SRCM116780]|uniref:SusD/RagB family nutrient-binding outer membrane lipoprotein n=1 Tax=Sphingobacterium sp. SRCM116780 TaxID=2907623 RepID=UPI001F37FC02|nr:SusD/RagB family nutrient-binding outer membrane lipoprotein [Sphingobacterium sp. SRCM116780]UIR54746.1 SusD/RagB family nutrient-binding outer membrane lipoprotein [Sphingobacterium sp. SRCM116780]